MFFLLIAPSSTIMNPNEPTLQQVQTVRCPTCGAGQGEKCELSTGQTRRSRILTDAILQRTEYRLRNIRQWVKWR